MVSSEVDAMNQTKLGYTPEPGDVVEITGHRVGDAPRSGEIVEVLGAPGHVHFRVRWEDGHESIFWPSSDAVIRSGRRRGPKKKS
jgi:hypothetical protein